MQLWFTTEILKISHGPVQVRNPENERLEPENIPLGKVETSLYKPPTFLLFVGSTSKYTSKIYLAKFQKNISPTWISLKKPRDFGHQNPQLCFWSFFGTHGLNIEVWHPPSLAQGALLRWLEMFLGNWETHNIPTYTPKILVKL